uniref:Uncharacterized protein n=1 Tax=Arundo donax TaxID=35708 RepID=A0A0A8Y560_ARUDO
MWELRRSFWNFLKKICEIHPFQTCPCPFWYMDKQYYNLLSFHRPLPLWIEFSSNVNRV